MEDQYGWKLEDYQVQVVYHSFLDHKEKTFLVSVEVRDYAKRYLINVNLNEKMFIDLITRYQEAKDAGYNYNNLDMKYRKGNDMK